MKDRNQEKLKTLIEKGVEIPCPGSVEIGPEVDPDRISGDGVTIHTGCKIFGPHTLIMENVKLGSEGPATVEDCQLGPNVKLGGGSFRNSTFLDGVTIGPGAQVRDSSLLEEGVRGAHSVGTKQTILFPFVTLGSLINFCDCLMAGGTGRKDYSEVGSSYIHFNYTPNRDKATPSLLGDVPRGVMLNQPPIFLGGQGGLVGPSVIGYGTVIAAGTVFRGDCPEGGKLIFGQLQKANRTEFHPGFYRNFRRLFVNNVNYIANLSALRQWYGEVRSLFAGASPMRRELHRGAAEKLDTAFRERMKRLGELVGKLPASAEIRERLAGGKTDSPLLKQKRELIEKWPKVEAVLNGSRESTGELSLRDPFLEKIDKGSQKEGNYLATVQGLEAEYSEKGTAWLQSIVDGINREILELLPSFRA